MVYDWLRAGSYSHFGWLKPAKVWRLYANIAGFMGCGVLFTLVLASVSSGTGAVFKVDGPATSDAMEIRNGIPTVRVPLGGAFEYDKHWHVLEGGCDRWMIRSFTQPGGERPYTLTLRERADSYAVGRPGTEHHRSALPAGITPGLWHYKADAEAICRLPGHKPQLLTLAEFNVEVFDPDSPVMRPLAPPALATPVVKPGGPLAYRLSWERTDSTPSEVYNTYSSVGEASNGTPDVVIERRPALNKPPGKHMDVDIAAPLPPGVGPGLWRLKQIVVSTRLGGRVRADPMFDLEFRVSK